MKYLYLFIAFIFPTVIFAQEFSSITSSTIANDSSFYDIKQISANTYWVAGEKGILMAINTDFEKHYIPYPNEGVNILKIGKLSDNHIILCADKGTIYHYYKNENKWQVQHLKGFKGKVLYNFTAINDKIAFICGGNSKIALSKKAMPSGFILKTIDGGLTWKKIYSSIGSMVWDVDTVNNNLVALKYNLLGSRLLTFNAYSNKIIAKSKTYKMLAHEYNAELKMLVGANDFHIYTSGKTIDCSTNITHSFTSLIWDITSFQNLKIGSSCSGKISIISANNMLQKEIQCPTHFNLYGIISVNKESLLLIGSNKTILKLNLYPNHIFQSINN
ncbi:MAG: hypothetical protein RI955_1238 [Bacteroidota bacterium]